MRELDEFRLPPLVVVRLEPVVRFVRLAQVPVVVHQVPLGRVPGAQVVDLALPDLVAVPQVELGAVHLAVRGAAVRAV